MKTFDVAYSSVRGNLHAIRELPNQDAIDVRRIDDVLIISLADGHGSRTCFRSDIGSKMAVEVANVLVADRLLKSDKNLAEVEEHSKELCRSVAGLWSKTVLNHLGKNAFKDEEVDELDESKKKSLGRNALLAYGTTLMTVILSENRILVMNIGDAELLVKFKDSDDIKVLNQNKRIGNETESLALPFAHRYYTVNGYDSSAVEAILAATDGYPNSFKQEEGYMKVINDLLGIANSHGIEAIQDNFENWLTDTSLNGSGDDITACFVTNIA